MQLYNEHLAKYLVDERIRYLAYEAEHIRLAKSLPARRKRKSWRKALALLNFFARSPARTDGR